MPKIILICFVYNLNIFENPQKSKKINHYKVIAISKLINRLNLKMNLDANSNSNAERRSSRKKFSKQNKDYIYDLSNKDIIESDS